MPGRAYLDYAATAPLDHRLHAEMMQASWANANSLYEEGRAARAQLEDARRRIARALGARQPAEIIFTSGGTEGDNMAVKGLLGEGSPEKRHIVVSAIEHHAVLDAAAACRRWGYHVDALPVGRDGTVSPEVLDAHLSAVAESGHRVALVAVMAVNNELGTVQPVRELADTAHRHDALFFTDCVQALGKLEIDLEASGVDAAAFSAHKVGGLKGCGVLYVRRRTRIRPLLAGGGQENGLRSGTSNVLGALTCAAAIENAVAEREAHWEAALGLRKQLLEGVAALDARHALRPTLAGNAACVPHIVSLLADGLEGETLVQRLDAAGIAVSSGSACSTGSLDPSHVISALGIPRQQAYGSLRISFGAGSTDADVLALLGALPHALR